METKRQDGDLILVDDISEEKVYEVLAQVRKSGGSRNQECQILPLPRK